MSDLEREKFEARFPPPPKEMKTALSHWIAKRDGWLARSESAPSPTRESLHAEWMAQEKYLDWSNFLLHKLTGESAPSDRTLWLAAVNDELANLRAWANRAEADLQHAIFCMDRACKRCRDLMTKYPAPGESAHATHDNLSCAVCGKGMELVSGDPRAFYKCSSCGSDPELTAGELGESAHATPPITLKEFLWNGTTCRLHGHGCCDDCLKLEALAMHVHLNAAGEAGSPAPAPTEEK